MAYCTQHCLRGLLRGGLLDQDCPNVELHRKQNEFHSLDSSTFRALIRKQFSETLDTNCHPLDMRGSRGALFKVQLASHGYTMVAKCTIKAYISHLVHEAAVYKQLEQIQGIHIPVCLGNIDLPNVLAYKRADLVHMLFLSWGGESIRLHAELTRELHVFGQAVDALRAIHELGVLHRDPKPRNILWSEETRRIMFIDFDRSEIRQSLALLKRSLELVSGQGQRIGGNERDSMDANNNGECSNTKAKAKKDDENGTNTPNLPISDEDSSKSTITPDTPKSRTVSTDTKPSSLSDYEREMTNMKDAFVALTL